MIHNQIIAHRHVAKEKSSQLKVQFEDEEAKVEALTEEHAVRDGSASATADEGENTTINWIPEDRLI